MNATTLLLLLTATVLFLPARANATISADVPEPLSLALLATGLAGLGAAEVIRRRNKK